MKPRKAILCATAFAALILMPGCIVRSLHPWFGKLDATFETDLLGGWVGVAEGSKLAMTFVRGEGNTYLVQYSNDDGRGVFLGTLGKIAGDYFLDFRPVEPPQTLDGFLLFPTHSLARLEFSRDKLSVAVLDYEGVKAAAKRERFKEYRHVWVDEDELLFTASEDEMRRFLVAHGRNSEFFREPMRMVRK